MFRLETDLREVEDVVEVLEREACDANIARPASLHQGAQKRQHAQSDVFRPSLAELKVVNLQYNTVEFLFVHSLSCRMTQKYVQENEWTNKNSTVQYNTIYLT